MQGGHRLSHPVVLIGRKVSRRKERTFSLSEAVSQHTSLAFLLTAFGINIKTSVPEHEIQSLISIHSVTLPVLSYKTNLEHVKQGGFACIVQP